MNKRINRRDFVKYIGAGILGLNIPNYLFSQVQPKKITAERFVRIPSPRYENIFHNEIEWENISKGLDFSRTKIYRKKELVDIIASIKINPEENKIQVFNGYNPTGVVTANIEKWQELTKSLAMINSAQYQGGEFYYKPCALMLGTQVSLGNKGDFNYSLKRIGPLKNKAVRGMLVSEPKLDSLPKADLLDFDYDSFDYKTNSYTQGVQHWPILLDREGRIKVKQTLWQANRTLVAKTKENEILFMTTEGGYFTLYNIGRFLKDSNQRQDKGFNIHTAMNMDGGYESQMIIKSPKIDYLNYGKFLRHNPNQEIVPFDFKKKIPGTIGVFSRH